MKMAFCGTNPVGAKILCATAASQYKTAGSSSTKPGASSSPVTVSSNEVFDWYCTKAGGGSDKTALCSNFRERSAVLADLRQLGLSADKRKALSDKLRTIPTMPFATQQGVYADFCKLAANSEKPTCTRIKMTQASNLMRKWYCEQGTNAEGNWCKRSALLDKLQKIPYNTPDEAKSAERKTLSAEYASFSKPPAGGGPSANAQIGKEIVEAKKKYCAEPGNKAIPYCEPLAHPSIGQSAVPGAGRRLFDRLLSRRAGSSL